MKHPLSQLLKTVVIIVIITTDVKQNSNINIDWEAAVLQL